VKPRDKKISPSRRLPSVAAGVAGHNGPGPAKAADAAFPASNPGAEAAAATAKALHSGSCNDLRSVASAFVVAASKATAVVMQGEC